MQNKGVIRLFAILFALTCLWELSFTFVAQSVESNATEVANGDADRKQAYLDSLMPVTVYDLGFDAVSFTYQEVKSREMNLGLDLRGGMNVILEVSVRDILKNLAGNTSDVMFNRALISADSMATQSQEPYVEIFFTELDRLIAENGGGRGYADPALFGTQMMTDRVGFNAGNDQVKQLIRTDVSEAVQNVYTVLKARIDQFGVVQPNVQRLEGSGRILVELPGVKDPDRVKSLLQSTARLEFWKAYKGYELLNFMVEANERLRTLVEMPADLKRELTEAAAGGDSASESMGVADFEGLDIEVDSASDVATDATEGAEVSEDSLLQRFNPIFNLMQLNLDENGSPRAGPFIGFALVTDTSKLNSYLNMPQVRALLPAQMRYAKFAWNKPNPESPNVTQLIALAGNRDNAPEMEGDVIVDARQDFNQVGQPVVTIAMDGVGAGEWQRLTQRLSEEEDVFDQPGHPSSIDGNGQRGYIAISLDGVVYSAPSVNQGISGGRTEISGAFTIEEASDLATVLRAGKLPVPTRIVQSDVVGPTLGAEAIKASLNSFMIALLLVMVYMIIYYNFAGIVADLSLILNMVFIFGLLDGIGAVLTLPGMAGIVLTIGMAVDANVIIYERIREELALGKDTRLAIRDGYKNSYSAILDANVTTLITAIILFAFGTGPIRGFATTLIIGIICSLFSAIFITRLIYEWRLSRKESVTFSTKISEGWMKNTAVKFIQKRKMAYIISGVLIVISVISLMTKGLNQGVDFVGGRSYQVRFDQPVDVSDIANSVAAQFVDESGQNYTPIVKTLGDASQVVITTEFRVEETGAEVDKAIEMALYEGVKTFFVNEISEAQFASPDEGEMGLVASRQVGPTIADDIERDAVLAIVFSLLAIFLYILLRFSKWQYSLGAVLAIVHDVIIVFGIFSMLDGVVPFQLEVDQAFVAAVLTVIGYSLNDTVVVFDRIREYFSHYHKKRSLTFIMNTAMNGTLSRTVNTSLTTLVVLMIILVFGGESIRGFIFAITVGVVVGTYSSLFVATPAVFDTMKKEGDDSEE